MTASIGIEWLRADVAEVLDEDLDSVGPDEDLLDLGVDSVRLMMLTQRWQDAGFDVDLVSLAERPTLAGWALLLGAAPTAPPPVDDVEGPVPATVVRVEQVTPRTLRITLASAARFTRARAGDHLLLTADGVPDARALTVRPHAASGELDVDVVAHGNGPLGRWASRARPGSVVAVDGPYAAPDLHPGPVDWTLLVADSTAFPALAARAAAMPGGARVVAVVVLPDAAEEQLLPTAADLDVVRIHAQPGLAPRRIVDALRSTIPQEGRGRAWVAGEQGLVAAVASELAGDGRLAGRSVSEQYWQVTAGSTDVPG